MEQPDPVTVLVVDDDPRSLELMRVILRHAGFQVLTAASGAQALDLVAEHPTQLAILDFWMPDMNGLQLAQRIRGQGGGAQVRLLLLTGMDDAQTRAEAIAAGFADVVVKPFERVDLLARIQAALDK